MSIGRVHWLLWELSADFKRAYKLEYDYATHNYVFYRLKGRKLYDIFIVYRSSKHYFKGVYSNIFSHYTVSFGYKKSRICAEIMCDIYSRYKYIEV